MGKTNSAVRARLRRKMHIRKTVRGTAARPRLTVFRSSNHIYAQIVDDQAGTTLAAASTHSDAVKVKGHGGNRAAATLVGAQIAKEAKKAGVGTVVFDRNGYLYHGRVQALADAAREGGLKF